MTFSSEPRVVKDSGTLTLQIADSIAEVDATQWDACAGSDNPFLRHAFLLALEESGSACRETGWLPQHLVIENLDKELLGVVPMYLKSHSYGEYVFDHAWADAYQRAGGRYYPKLQISVPFTPVTGRRLLVRPGTQAARTEDALIAGCRALAERLSLSSVHVAFPTEREWRRLGRAGFLLGTGLQFHWENRGYAEFDDFLSALSSRKRKVIRKERREARSHDGLLFETLTGEAIEERHWDAFFGFYHATSDRNWGYPYLTRGFFSRLGETMPEKVVLMMVARDRHYIAGALNLLGSDSLYGRNWGCIEDHRFLHFETCYYRAIEYAIEHGVKRVEAGAQGPHKLARGYLPRTTYSAHWICDPRLREPVAKVLIEERRQTDDKIEILDRHRPFRKQAE